MPEIIVEKETPFQTLKVALDGVNYIARLEWNMRSGWYLGLSDAAGDPIFSPKKLVIDRDLLRSVTDERRPPGKLYLFDLALGGEEECSYEGLGLTHAIVYLSEDELEAFGV